mgnify:CR=1 FL=1
MVLFKYLGVHKRVGLIFVLYKRFNSVSLPWSRTVPIAKFDEDAKAYKQIVAPFSQKLMKYDNLVYIRTTECIQQKCWNLVKTNNWLVYILVILFVYVCMWVLRLQLMVKWGPPQIIDLYINIGYCTTLRGTCTHFHSISTPLVFLSFSSLIIDLSV